MQKQFVPGVINDILLMKVDCSYENNDEDYGHAVNNKSAFDLDFIHPVVDLG